MDKKTALKSIQNQIDEIKNLQRRARFSSGHIKWWSDTNYLVEDIFGENSRIYLSFSNLSWQPSGAFVADMYSMDQVLEQKRQEAYLSALERGRGILMSGIEQIKRKGIENVYEGKNPVTQSSD